MARVIRSTRNADRDVHQNMRWVARKYSNRAALRWHAAILKAIRTLKEGAERWPLAEESPELGMELRQLIVKRYRGVVFRILYEIDADTVIVHRIRNAAQDSLTEDDL